MRSSSGKFKLRINKKTLLITLGIVVSVFVLLTIAAFAKRESMLDKAVSAAIRKAKSKYNLNVKIGSYKFEGLSSVNFNGISVVPENRETLSEIKNATVGVKLLPLIFGNIKISKFNLDDGSVSFIKKDSISNYDFLFRKDSTKSEQQKTEVDFADLANKLIHQALDKIPDEMNINNFKITYEGDTSRISIYTQSASINDKEVNSKIIINNNEAVWHITGTADPSNEKLDLKLFADKNKTANPGPDADPGFA